MKAAEFRLGNWVYKDGKIKLVTIFVLGDIQDFPNHFIGIPLTPELLAKCGKVYSFANITQEDTFLIGKKPRVITIQLYDETQKRVWFADNGNYIGVLHLQYLHELQNLYFALTGVELTIDL